jgi:hypothetical protein
MSNHCHDSWPDHRLANRVIDLADRMKELFDQHRPLNITATMIDDLYLAGATIIRNLDCDK